jgi:hypothetical protein
MISFTFRFLSLYIFCSFVTNAIAKEGIPSKIEFDSIMINAVKQMNAQMAGQKTDEYTIFKFITYDKNPPMITYFLSSNPSSVPNMNKFDKSQTDAMAKFNILKTCASPFRVFMKPYGLKVSHIFENGHTGLVLFKLTVSHSDC